MSAMTNDQLDKAITDKWAQVKKLEDELLLLHIEQFARKVLAQFPLAKTVHLDDSDQPDVKWYVIDRIEMTDGTTVSGDDIATGHAGLDSVLATELMDLGHLTDLQWHILDVPSRTFTDEEPTQ